MLSLPGPAWREYCVWGVSCQCKGHLITSQGDYKHKVNKIEVLHDLPADAVRDNFDHFDQ